MSAIWLSKVWQMGSNESAVKPAAGWSVGTTDTIRAGEKSSV